MQALKQHLAVQKDATIGGAVVHITATLCGRENKESDDGTNSTDARIDVTCGHCRKILADPKHWTLRKWNVQPD